MTETLKCPPLGMGSVDFGALHEADAKAKTNADLVAAVEASTTRVEPPAPLTGKELLGDLKKLADEEGIVAGADWRADDYRAALEAKRNPPPPQPLSEPTEPLDTVPVAQTAD